MHCMHTKCLASHCILLTYSICLLISFFFFKESAPPRVLPFSPPPPSPFFSTVLVSQGAQTRRPDEPVLLLKNERGGVGYPVAEPLARLLTDVAHPPRLVVLTACHGAGQG